MEEAQCVGKIAAETPPRIAIHRYEIADLVIPETIGVEFLNIETRVVDEKPTNIIVPEREGKSSGAAVLICEVEAVIVIAHIRSAIEIVDALIIERIVYGESAGVVVHHVEHDGDAVDVTQVNQSFELRRPGGNIFDRDRSDAFGFEQTIDSGKILRERDGAGNDVREVRGEVVGAVVAHRRIRLYFVDGQWLEHVDSQSDQVRNFADDVQKG